MIIDINPVAFYLPIPFVGWWPVYWYGISWVIAILSIHWFAKRNIATNANFTEAHVEDFLFYGVLGAIVGGRLGYMLFYGMDQILSDPFSILRVWEGGLSFHGGLFGVIVAFLIFSKK